MNAFTAITTLGRELLSVFDAVVATGSLENARRAVGDAERRRHMKAAVYAATDRPLHHSA